MIPIIHRISILFLALLALELIFHLLAGLLGVGFFRVVFLCLLGAGFLSSLSFFLPHRAAYIAVLALFGALTLLMIAQLIYFKVFHSFFTVYSMMNGTGAFQFTDILFTTIAKNIPAMLLLLLPFGSLIAAWQLRFWPEVMKMPPYYAAAPLAAIVCLQLALTLPLARDPSSARARRWGQGDIQSSVSRSGLLTTMQIDLLSRFVKPEGSAALEGVTGDAPRLPTPAPAAPTPSSVKGGKTDTPPPITETPPPWQGRYNKIDIDFDALLEADRQNNALSQLHSYFAALEPSAQNDHTGMFEGYNLIFLTCESFSHLAIDPKLTPTLYRMYAEGIRFTDFYNPVWGVSTTDGEYVACLGLLPKPGVWSMYRSAENELPFALGNQLGSLGYQCRAYHNHTYTYYHRDKSHPNLGYDYKGLGNGLDVKKSWPESDLEMIEKTVDEYIGAEPFHTYYMTVSGHMNYSFTGNSMSAKHRDAVRDLPYSEPVKAYLATQVELDLAMEHLNRRLEEEGIAERTLIVMVADHYPYGLTTAELGELAGTVPDETFGIYQSGLIIYAKGMEPETVDSPVFSPDVIPTLQNLMGLRFDSRLFSGRDVFSDAPPLVFTANRSFITEGGRYDAKTKVFTPTPDVAVPEGYRETVSSVIEARFAAASKVLDLDYFKRIHDELAKREEAEMAAPPQSAETEPEPPADTKTPSQTETESLTEQNS